jgi:membrane protease YdiL (CAAX protease family)
LQFVVITLMASTGGLGSGLEVRAFGTPTVVHFCFALIISAIANAPWHSLPSARVAFAFSAAAGLGYALTVIRHARRAAYTPDAEDWFWYAVLPLATYATWFVAAITLTEHPAGALFVIAGTSLVLLFIGIHNAWDTVTYVVLKHTQRSRRDRERVPPEQNP